MKRKVLSFILALALLCSVFSRMSLLVNAAVTSGQCGDNLYWSFDESTGKLTITGNGDMWDYVWNPTPYSAFQNQIKSVALPNGIKSIGGHAFYACEKLNDITIPYGVTSIGNSAFSDCYSLTNITIPKSVIQIDSFAFCWCTRLESISIPDGITRIESGTFYWCSKLKHIEIPDSVTEIGETAFMNCYEITSIAIPYGVKRIETGSFNNCTKLTSVTIPDSVTSIGVEAFYGSKNLRDIYFSGSKEQWEKISIDTYNEPLINAAIHYNSSEADIPISFCGYNARFKTDYFSEPASNPNKELALLSGILSWAVYHDDGRPSIRDVYSMIGIPSRDYFDNSVEREKDLRFSIAKKTVVIDGVKTNLLLIIARGTVNEALRDHFTKANSYFQGYKAYDLVYEFQEDIMSQLVSFCDSHNELEHEPLKVLITGHSLGGAAANLIAARFTQYADGGSWWANVASKEDIFCYTFGSIDSINTDGTVSKGFENIHNITNFFDSYGPNGWPAFVSAAGRSRYGKFGHIDLFYDNRDNGEFGKFENHMIGTYLDAVVAKQNDLNRVFYENPDHQKLISVHCPVDVSIYRNNELVGQIINNKVNYNVTQIPMSVVDESKYILIPSDNNYRIEITATDIGIMDYECKDAATGNDVKQFLEVHLKENKRLCTEVGGVIKTQDVKLYVLDTEGIPVLQVQENGTEVPVSNPFFDVNQGAYYYDAVLWAVSHDPQITNGTNATHYSPESTCTRAQVMTLLWRAAGCPEPLGTGNPFNDVASDAYYFKAVLWAMEKGITTGTSASKFNPNSGCTRGQVVTFLWRVPIRHSVLLQMSRPAPIIILQSIGLLRKRSPMVRARTDSAQILPAPELKL